MQALAGFHILLWCLTGVLGLSCSAVLAPTRLVSAGGHLRKHHQPVITIAVLAGPRRDYR